MLHRFVPPSEKLTLFHLLPISICFMGKNTPGLGTCSELTGFIIKQKLHLAVSFLDTVMIFLLYTWLACPCSVQSISHRESLSNLTTLHMLLVLDPKQTRSCWKPQGASALWFQLSKSPFTPHHHFTALGTPTVPHWHGTPCFKKKVRNSLQNIDGTPLHGMLTLCWGHLK